MGMEIYKYVTEKNKGEAEKKTYITNLVKKINDDTEKDDTEKKVITNKGLVDLSILDILLEDFSTESQSALNEILNIAFKSNNNLAQQIFNVYLNKYKNINGDFIEHEDSKYINFKQIIRNIDYISFLK